MFFLILFSLIIDGHQLFLPSSSKPKNLREFFSVTRIVKKNTFVEIGSGSTLILGQKLENIGNKSKIDIHTVPLKIIQT